MPEAHPPGVARAPPPGVGQMSVNNGWLSVAAGHDRTAGSGRGLAGGHRHRDAVVDEPVDGGVQRRAGPTAQAEVGDGRLARRVVADRPVDTGDDARQGPGPLRSSTRTAMSVTPSATPNVGQRASTTPKSWWLRQMPVSMT